MIRSLGVPAAIAVLVAINAVFSPPASEKPAPRTGALTVALEEPATTLKVRAPAPAPDAGTEAVLRDDSGKHIGRVVSTGQCDGTPREAFPGATGEWCLRLSEIAAGHELTGTIANTAENALTLTVNRRDGFWPLPAALLALGLAVGFLTLLVPTALKRFVRRIVLARLLRRNGDAHQAGVQDLDGWVKRQLAKPEADPDAILVAVSEMVESGRARAVEARERLRQGLEAASLGEHPYGQAAAAIADPEKTNTVTDFYGEDGKRRKDHPADEWLSGLKRLLEYKREIETRAKQIDDHFDPNVDNPAKVELRQARTEFGEAASPDDVERLAPRLDELITAIQDELAKQLPADEQHRRAVGVAGTPGTLAIERAPRGVIDTLVPLDLSRGTLAGWTGFARLLTAAVLVLVLLYAVLSVKSSTYDAKPLFDSFNDYLALFSAALGSGVAATVVAMLGYWKPPGAGEAEA